MKKKIILAAVTALVVLMTFTVTGVYAKTASELDKELSDTQKKLNKGTEQEESLEKQISKLEKQITKKEAELVTLSGKSLGFHKAVFFFPDQFFFRFESNPIE